MEQSKGGIWVKASERLPADHSKLIIKDSSQSIISFGFKDFDEENPRMYYENNNKAYLSNEVEWLDESVTPVNSQDFDMTKVPELEIASYDYSIDRINNHKCPITAQSDVQSAYIAGALKFNPNLVNSQEDWISVEDRLPDVVSDRVIACFNGVVGELYYSNLSNRFFSLIVPDIDQTKVTHWQPLPSPPKQ